MTLEMWEGPPVKVWPDNRLAVMVMLAMRTQWHVGFSGRTGLVYASLAEVWERLKVPEDKRDEVFFDLQIMEGAALAAMYEDE